MKTAPILFATLGISIISLTGCAASTPTNSDSSATPNTNVTVSNVDISNTNVGATNNANTNAVVENNNLNIYENVEYGFSFKYPKDWNVLEDGKYINIYSIEQFQKLTNDAQTSPSLYITIEDSGTKYTSIEDIYKDEDKYTVTRSNPQTAIIEYENFNTYANSNMKHYVLENKNTKIIIHASFFSTNIDREKILSILQSIEFNS